MTMSQVVQFAPVVFFHEQEPFLPCAIEYLLSCSTLYVNGALLPNPTQQTLVLNSGLPRNPGWYLDLTDCPTAGSMPAPMYVSVQVPANESFVDLNFYFLFAFNGPECVHAEPPGLSPFDCFVANFADHQGDIEGISVRVDPSFKTVTWVRYEAHGDSVFYPPSAITWWTDANGVKTTNPVVYSALHSHATYPGTGPAQSGNYVVVESHGPLDFSDYIRPTNQSPWIPFERTNGKSVPNGMLLFVGLDQNWTAVGDQVWARFEGYIGKTLQNSFVTAEAVGEPLSLAQAMFAASAAEGYQSVAKVLTPRRFVGEGPAGLGARASIHMNQPCWGSWMGGTVATPFSGVAKSSQGPALVTVGDVLVMVYPAGTLKWAVYQESQPIGSQWTDRQGTGLSAAANITPALAGFNDSLVMVYVDSNNALHWATLDYSTNQDPTSWSWVDNGPLLNLTSKAGAALCVFGNTLYLVYPAAGGKGQLSWATYDGTTWSSQGQILNGAMTSQSTPGLAADSDSIYMVYRGQQSNNLYVAWFSQDAWVNPKSNRLGSQGTGAGPSLAILDGDIVSVYLTGGSDHKIYYTFELGEDFGPDNWSNPQCTYAAPGKCDLGMGTPSIAVAPDVDGVMFYMAYLDDNGSGAIWLNTCSALQA